MLVKVKPEHDESKEEGLRKEDTDTAMRTKNDKVVCILRAADSNR